MAERYRKTKEMKMSEVAPSGGKPYLHLSFKDLPEAKNWKVGEIYKIGLEVKQTEMHESEGYGGAGFEIVGIMVEKGKSKPKRYGKEKA